MPVTQPRGLRAGFHARPSDRSVGLIHAGEQWAPTTFAIERHSHAGWELYLQAHGTTSWSIAPTRRRLAPGDLLAVQPGVEHALERPAASHHFLYAAFDAEAVFARLPGLRTAWASHDSHRHVAAGDRLLPAFQTLIRELTMQFAFEREGLVATLDMLVIEATRVLAASRAAPVLAMHPAVTATRERLDAHFDRRWPLRELAASVGLSAKHLHQLFSHQIGVTPHRYQLDRRLQRAQQLLAATDLPITAVALEVGFGSGQQLARAFRRHVGHTPRAHRQLNRYQP